jgi:hypothetical protein
MRNWIDLLESHSIPAVIYHGTSLRALIRIVGLDALLGGEDDNGGAGTFCSGEMATSMRYIADHMYNGPDGAVMVLDTNAIKVLGHDISLYHYYEGNDGDEYLIDCSTHDLKPISTCLNAIIMPRANHDILRQIVSNDSDIAFVDEEWDNGMTEYFAAANKLFSMNITVV